MWLGNPLLQEQLHQDLGPGPQVQVAQHPVATKDLHIQQDQQWDNHSLSLVYVEQLLRADKMWSTGERTGKPLQYSCLENPMNSMKRQKNITSEEESPHAPV